MAEGASPDRFKDLLQAVADELKARGIVLPGVVTGQWGTFGRFIRGGWRSIGAWICVLALFVNGVVLPLARLWGFKGEPIDWQGLAVFVPVIAVLAHYRSQDLRAGATT